ncbi:MAG: ATP-binding cassette domain-containing protein [Hyphomicrobiales bacterium]|nr:ATP-binding cassette domain-containing protein [Hyphomicrobiales bacterium]
MTLLEVENIRFSYELDHKSRQSSDLEPGFEFNLQLDAGKIFAIAGRSGSGKSTLLDLLAGFLIPGAGKIILDDHDITDENPSKRQISILFQNNNLFEHLNVLDNVCLGLSPNKRPTKVQKQKAIQMISRVGLQHFEGRMVATLSGGQMQRVALARELLRQTKLILLDEPFNGLDEDSREVMMAILKQAVRERQRSIILVTHDIQSIRSIVDILAEVKDGKLQFGTLPFKPAAI